MNAVDCILHVGTEKTGTTSLQRFLAMNVGNFAGKAVWVPKTLVWQADGGPYNHALLSTASHLSTSEPDDLQQQLGLMSMTSVREHRRSVESAIKAERVQLGFDPKYMIVSNEHIQSRLRTDADLTYAKGLLEPFCSSFRVVVYLRSQSELARSLAVSAVRNGALEYRPIPDFLTANGFDDVLGVDYGYFDYYELLQRLERVFGPEALTVRIYESSELEGNDIISDFFHALNLDIDRMPRPGRENTSLNREAVLFLIKLNRFLQSKPRGPIIRQRVLDLFSESHQAVSESAVYADIKTFMSKFAGPNESVRAKWFPTRKNLFYEKVPKICTAPGSSELSEESAFKMAIDLFGRSLDIGW